MNIDEKIPDKIFQVVHYDPAGFILGLQKQINTRKSIHVVWYPHRLTEERHWSVSVDAEKGFD